MGGGYDDFDGGGESVITLEEFQDLKRAIQTLVEAQASQRRGSRSFGSDDDDPRPGALLASTKE